MKIPLRYVLVLSSLVVLLATVGWVLFSSYRTESFAVHDLSDQILAADGQRVNDAVENLLQMVTRRSAVAEGLLRHEVLDTNQETISAADFPHLTALFEAIAAANPELSYLSLGVEGNGEYCHVFRRPDGVLEQQECVRQPNGKILRSDYQQNEGKRVRTQGPVVTDYDPRKRPYYKEAKKAKRHIWTDTYLFRSHTGPDVPGITYATPLYRADGSLIGVLSADFTLENLNDFTRTIRIGETGYVFIVEQRRDGTQQVIAHPDSHVIGGNTASNTLISAFLREAGSENVARRSDSLRFRDGKKVYLANVRHLNSDRAPRWILCALVPEAEVMARIERSAAQNRLIALLGLLLGTLVSIFVSYRICTVLARITAETDRVRRLELEPRPLRTRVQEVAALGGAVEQMKADLRSFAKFVPRDYVRHLVITGQEAQLHGERRTITVAFVDIVQFTAFAEKTSPEELVSVLGDILDVLSARISEHYGTLDKYIGDEIVALWGAQWGSLESDADHARHACVAAIRCQEALAAMREKWETEGKTPLAARIGLNTGPVIVGAMGSSVRLAYTALGDPMNLGKRLESLNNLYGTRILASDATVCAAGDSILTRPVDLVAVVGRTEPVLVHEVMGVRGEMSLSEERLAERMARAMEYYRARHWSEAIAALEEVLMQRPGDGPARLLLESCRDYSVAPPGREWDGVRRMLKK